MNLLAIDCACSILSVAVSKGESIFYTETEAGVRHNELVMNFIDNQMKKANLKANELDGVLCMAGPGSFTGLRIGYSIAKGLSLSLSIPFSSVPTLDCMAFPERDSGLVLSAIEAGKNKWFYAFYREGKSLKPAADTAASNIEAEIENYLKNEKIILTGAASLYDALPQKLRENIILKAENRGYAGELIAVAKKNNLLNNDNSALLYSGPEYVRKTDAELIHQKLQLKNY